jgi:hypothetical protein
MAEKQYTMEEIKEFGKALGLVQKHDPTAGASTFNYVHGPGGMFSEPGIRPEMHSALQRANTFLDNVPWFKSEVINEKISILTGQLAAEGTNAANTCSDPPFPGDLKKCTRLSEFGKLFLKTKKVDITEIGRRNDRADVERRIQNFASTDSPLVPDLLRKPGLNLMSTSAQALLTLGVEVERIVAQLEIDGNAATVAGASTTLGVITEFDGLSLLVKTGHTDLSTSTACPAADSHVITWNRSIDGTFEGLNIMEMLNDVYYSRKTLADEVGMTGTRWALVMDKRLFRALTFIAACTYAHTRCTDFNAGTPGQRDQSEVEARQREFKRGQYLPLDGDNVPVLFTSGTEVSIPDQSGNDQVADLFLVPMAWSGGPLIFGEYFPLDNQYIQEWDATANQNRQSLNSGMFLTAARSDGFCDELLLTSIMRLRLDTPFLAARIDDITFNSYRGYRDFEPGATFHYDGGVTSYSG